LAELGLAGLALFVWAISPPGVLKSTCFMVSSVTLISTLLVNLNPAMRFDGYYVLSDLLGIDNLQARSFAVTRWALRRHVLGMNVEPPEAAMPRRRLAVMIAYAVLAWAYRLFLYSGIALMLYYRVTRVVGGILFAAVIYMLIVKPVVTEAVSVMRLGRRVGWNRRMVLATLTCGFVAIWAAWPQARWQSAPATTLPRHSQTIYAPSHGVIRELDIGPGSVAQTGQVLCVIESEELESQARLARLEMRRIQIELSVIRNEDEHRSLLREKRDELARAEATLETILAVMRSNRIVSEVGGTVVEWDESVRNGTPIGGNQVLGRIVDLDTPFVVCYVRHDHVSDIAPEDRVYFVSKAAPGRLPGVVRNVDPVRTSILEHPGLSSTSGGDIAATPDAQGRLHVVDSYYEVEVAVDRSGHALRLGQTGQVWMRTAPRSRLADLTRYLYSVLVRESSF